MTYKADELQPVSNLIRIPNIISAHPSVPIKTIPRPDRLHQGQSGQADLRLVGVGQSPHLTAAWFLQLTGLKVVHVPFRGAGPALQAALPAGNSSSCSTISTPPSRRWSAGKLRALAVTTPERAALAPNVPTMRESAPELAKFDVSSWFGIFLPKSAPAPVVDALNKEIKVFLEREDIKTSMAKIGARTDYGTPQQYTDIHPGGDREVRRRRRRKACRSTRAELDDLILRGARSSRASLEGWHPDGRRRARMRGSSP